MFFNHIFIMILLQLIRRSLINIISRNTAIGTNSLCSRIFKQLFFLLCRNKLQFVSIYSPISRPNLLLPFFLAYSMSFLFRHLLPSITSDLAVLASLDVGWAIINISTLSFLGLGVQAPTPEWGAMLNEAKEVLTSNPTQMIAPGIAIVALVCCFNLMGDALRDVLDPKEVDR